MVSSTNQRPPTDRIRYESVDATLTTFAPDGTTRRAPISPPEQVIRRYCLIISYPYRRVRKERDELSCTIFGHSLRSAISCKWLSAINVVSCSCNTNCNSNNARRTSFWSKTRSNYTLLTKIRRFLKSDKKKEEAFDFAFPMFLFNTKTNQTLLAISSVISSANTP